jgi:hypothetical protein
LIGGEAVSRSLQREILTDILEGMPSFGLFALWRSGVDAQTAGWVAAGLAACILIGFRARGVRFNPILLGINVHILIITPLIVTLFHFGALEMARTVVAYAHQGVTITIFLTGCALTLASPDGLVGLEGLPRPTAMIYSALLLVASLAAMAWAFSYPGGGFVSIAVPVMALFGLRRLLIARWLDKNGQSNGLALAAGGSALASDSASSPHRAPIIDSSTG